MEHNFSTWYLLPLIQLGKGDFGTDNFRESYINQAGTKLMVHVFDSKRCPDIIKHPLYMGTNSDEMMLFTLPGKWQTDFEYFRKGQYSLFSRDAKSLIFDYSGLRHLNDNRGSERTDARLLALDKSDVLREAWIIELGLNETGNEILSDKSELLDIPSAATYRE